MRIDMCDAEASESQDIDCGYDKDFLDKFETGDVLGKGGFGAVYNCVDKATGKVYACKAIKKVLDLPNISATKVQRHVANIQREVAVLKRLRGSLSVVQLEAVAEDDDNVYIIMERCTGGELWRPRGHRDYSENAVAQYMRAVMRTLAQCHKAGILHRDIKPGNFMLLNTSPNSPVKAIDFGMAVFYTEAELPLTNLGLDGTAWFMAPELLSSEAYPASDVWAAGVMAYQMLSGYLPFDDRRNPDAPSLSVIWKSILSDTPSFDRSCWNDISSDAKDFIRLCLTRDRAARLSALAALQHPWLAPETSEAGGSRPLASNVIAHIQRFAARDALQRSILPLIANELLQRLNDRSESKHPRSADGQPSAAEGSFAGLMALTRGASGALGSGNQGSGKLGSSQSQPGAMPQGGGGSPSGRLIRNASELMLASAAMQEGSVKGRSRMRRNVSTGVFRAQEQIKAARLALDLSGRGARRSSGAGQAPSPLQGSSSEASRAGTQDRPVQRAVAGNLTSFSVLPQVPEREPELQACPETTRRGGSAALKQLSMTTPGPAPTAPVPIRAGAASELGDEDDGSNSQGLSPHKRMAGGDRMFRAVTAAPGEHHDGSAGTLRDKLQAAVLLDDAAGAPPPPPGNGTVHSVHSRRLMQSASRHDASVMAFLVRFVDTDTRLEELKGLLRSLHLLRQNRVSAGDFKQALAKLGFQLSDDEAAALLRYIGSCEEVSRDSFVASQLDWNKLQENHTEMWLECARETFKSLDKDQDGVLAVDDLMAVLRQKLGDDDVDLAVEESMISACAESWGLTFEQFVGLLQHEAPLAVSAFDSRYIDGGCAVGGSGHLG